MHLPCAASSRGPTTHSTWLFPFSFLLWFCPGSDRRGRTPAGLPVEGLQTVSVVPAEGFTFSSHHRARISAHPCQISSQSRGNNFFCFFSPKPFGFRFSAVVDRENAVCRAKLEDFRGFTMKLKNSELVLLLGTDPVIATAIVIGVEEIPDGTRFTMRTGAKVSHYSKLHGSRGKFEISRVEREGDRWIVEGKRLGG